MIRAGSFLLLILLPVLLIVSIVWESVKVSFEVISEVPAAVRIHVKRIQTGK
jgi:hypothetical protein